MAMKKKGYRKGGAMKRKGMAKGGKLKMVEKGGKKVPFFAADGKGKMAGGGMMKKKGYAKGGSVKVKSGDTLSQIAKKKGVTLKALLKANPGIKNANMIKVGQNIKVPTGQGKSIGPAGRSSNPYKGIRKNEMAGLGKKTVAEAATSSIRNDGFEAPSKPPKTTVKRGDRRNAAAKNAASVKASKDGSASAMAKARRRRAAAKKAPPKRTAPKPTSKPSMFDRFKAAVKPNRPGSAKMAGGGAMKKKGMSKGGVARGTGAATRGKRFGRAG